MEFGLVLCRSNRDPAKPAKRLKRLDARKAHLRGEREHVGREARDSELQFADTVGGAPGERAGKLSGQGVQTIAIAGHGQIVEHRQILWLARRRQAAASLSCNCSRARRAYRPPAAPSA